ncbi:MAG: SRPBCC family protein [Pseudomonadales bacterium]
MSAATHSAFTAKSRESDNEYADRSSTCTRSPVLHGFAHIQDRAKWCAYENLDRMSYAVDFDANEFAGAYSSWFLWPLFSFQVYPGNILNTYQWQPIDVDRVNVLRGWHSIDGEASETMEELARQDRLTTIEEDLRLVESVQRGLNSRGYNPGSLVVDPDCGINSEHSLATLQGWLKAAIDGD